MIRLLTFFFLLLPVLVYGTHNRAGELQYTHLGGLTYEVVITTCTKTSVIADRPELEFYWGDGDPCTDLDTLERESITFVQGLDAQINVYRGVHTYGGPGEYLMQMIDPNRNEGVVNIAGSVEEQFSLQALLVIGPQTGHNDSVRLLNQPKERACVQNVWQHNPGAFDPDGDLLVYSLITNLGQDQDDDCMADPIIGYVSPEIATGVATDQISIDEQTGTVTWDAPDFPLGEYNIAILIEEFREVNGQLFKVGHVIRDMQIEVIQCDNSPPDVEQVADTCIVAFNNLSFTVQASDPNEEEVNISAVGGPFSQVTNPAFFTPGDDNNGSFSWTPQCEEIRNSPYQVTFIATDVSPQINLTTFMTMNIQVVAPPVENPNAEAAGNSITLTWDPHPCVEAFTASQVQNGTYKIYRRQGLFGFEPDHCELGVPAYTGYQLIGEVEGLENSTYLDDDGVFYGEFCYMIVMCLPDGSESIASEEFCGVINKDTPVMTNASVEATDASNGEMYIAWSPANELDTELFPGPYRYELLHGNGNPTANTVIYSSEPNADLLNEDTTFVQSGIDTENLQHYYRVNLYSNDELVGSSVNASSIFLEPESGDQEIVLFMTHLTPWTNSSYEVYRRGPGESEFSLIATTDSDIYTDGDLENNVSYCYFVRSFGAYAAGGTVDPIVNNSQEVCAVPVDLTPPCTPEFTVEADCENEVAYLSWSNPNNSCEETNDTEIYHLYFAPTPEDELSLFAVFDSASDTSFVVNEEGLEGSIAGCYAITALDSISPDLNGQLTRNESPFSEIICIDNCPFYFLPNIFSPNNDGVNDLFTAFPWKFIESVDFKVFNRWGNLVFETEDPFINWNGTDLETGEVCTDGTYFYVAKVNTIRLEGIVSEELTGTITLVDGANPIRE